ncbi:BatD family protein [Gilvimarinus polysaccharolyticus]|uniref:BatD family protein n=1 Tax=Gilvimarinus polysaccharolyticus TaxID=863921 RepID=UPI0006736D0A|nr:BatD family protein [Gilvimarinus polysaccharolyticus]
MIKSKTLTQCRLSSANLLRVLALLVCVLAGVGTSAQASSASLSAQVTRTQISINDQLSVKFQLRGGSQASEPDFSPVQEDFEILSTYRSQHSTTINGKHDAYFEWDLTLAPKRLGQLTVPSIRAAGTQSESISITVKEAQQNPATADADVFMTVEPDKSSVYVQEQVLLKAKIFARQNFDAQEIQDFSLDQVTIEAIAENKYVTEIAGTPYAVYELTFALYPQKSGTLSIPSLDYGVRLRSNRRSILSFGGGEIRRGRSSPIELEVKPIPATNGSGPWLPASAISLKQHFSHDTKSLTAGEPITRSITLSAEGLHPSQLPPIATIDTEGFSTYTDKPQTQERRSETGLSSERTDTIAMVPSSAGRRTLPPLELKWFNTTTGEFEVARLPAVETQTKMPVGDNNPAVAATPPPQTSTLPGSVQTANGFNYQAIPRYLIVSQAVTLILLIIMTALYLRTRSREPQEPKPGAKQDNNLWRAIKKAGATDNLPELRRALLLWAETHFAQPISRLEQIAYCANKTQQHDELLRQLRALDQAIYHPNLDNSDSKAFSPGDLLPLIQQLRVQKRDASDSNLAPLYPQQ